MACMAESRRQRLTAPAPARKGNHGRFRPIQYSGSRSSQNFGSASTRSTAAATRLPAQLPRRQQRRDRQHRHGQRIHRERTRAHRHGPAHAARASARSRGNAAPRSAWNAHGGVPPASVKGSATPPHRPARERRGAEPRRTPRWRPCDAMRRPGTHCLRGAGRPLQFLQHLLVLAPPAR